METHDATQRETMALDMASSMYYVREDLRIWHLVNVIRH